MTELKVLFIAGNEFELGAVTSILKDNGMPYLIKDRGLGAYMRIYSARTIEGTEILVNEESLDRARELIANFLEDEGEVEG